MLVRKIDVSQSPQRCYLLFLKWSTPLHDPQVAFAVWSAAAFMNLSQPVKTDDILPILARIDASSPRLSRLVFVTDFVR